MSVSFPNLDDHSFDFRCEVPRLDLTLLDDLLPQENNGPSTAVSPLDLGTPQLAADSFLLGSLWRPTSPPRMDNGFLPQIPADPFQMESTWRPISPARTDNGRLLPGQLQSEYPNPEALSDQTSANPYYPSLPQDFTVQGDSFQMETGFDQPGMTDYTIQDDYMQMETGFTQPGMYSFGREYQPLPQFHHQHGPNVEDMALPTLSVASNSSRPTKEKRDEDHGKHNSSDGGSKLSSPPSSPRLDGWRPPKSRKLGRPYELPQTAERRAHNARRRERYHQLKDLAAKPTSQQTSIWRLCVAPDSIASKKKKGLERQRQRRQAEEARRCSEARRNRRFAQRYESLSVELESAIEEVDESESEQSVDNEGEDGDCRPSRSLRRSVADLRNFQVGKG
ncbi:hypothetical protein MMC21_006907 [Puttea exsequens]|nr:hypothetical protein [Puttea exsequens]